MITKNHHFSKRNQLITKMALKNCHVQGLHGIVFHKNGQLLQRMFIATQDHVLYQNSCKGDQPSQWQPFSLAIHPHRIDIQIQVITGTIWNMEFEKVSNNQQSQAFSAFKWNSHILKTQKTGGFQKVGNNDIELKCRRKLGPGDKIKMRSDQLHTVFIEKRQQASWFITQSQPTGVYDGITFANHNLQQWTSKNLYQKPSQSQICQYLKIAGIELSE